MESCSVRNAICLQISPCAVGPFSLRLVYLLTKEGDELGSMQKLIQKSKKRFGMNVA